MSFIEKPNLPANNVKTIIIDSRASSDICKGLVSHGIQVLKTLPHPYVYEAISCHPDVFIHHLGQNRIIYAKGTDINLLHSLDELGFILIEGKAVLTSQYPGCIAYNAARVGDYLFHNLKYTDPVLLFEAERVGVKPVHVNQGYTKCSVSIVDEKSIITSDKGIYKAAISCGIDVLLIEPDNSIVLNGLNMGFIGGSSGLIGNKKWAVTGNIRRLKSYDAIINFLGRRGIEAVCITEGSVTDIGSILPILQCNERI